MSCSIAFTCIKCRKYLGITYHVTGNNEAIVCDHMAFKCNHNHCKRVITPKKYSERYVIQNSENGKFFI